MAKLSKQEVEHIVRLSKLALTDAEVAKYTEQLSDVLEYVSQIDELATENIKDITILETENVARNDIAREIWKRDDLLKNAPQVENGYIVVPEVFEKNE